MIPYSYYSLDENVVIVLIMDEKSQNHFFISSWIEFQIVFSLRGKYVKNKNSSLIYSDCLL